MDGLRETLRRTGGIHAVADRLGQPFSDISRIADAALPLLASAFHHTARDCGAGEAGCRAMIARLDRLGGGAMAIAVMSPDEARAWPGKAHPSPGEALLDMILPHPGARAAVVNAVAREAESPVWQVAAALPVLAMLVGGYVAARSLEHPAVCTFDDLLLPGDDAALAVVMADAGVT